MQVYQTLKLPSLPCRRFPMSAKTGVREFQKIDPHLRTHPYFKRLARITGKDPNLLHGVLCGLWAFAYDHAQDGDLSRFTPDDIADGCDWSFEAEEMVEALVKSGFLTKEHVIHDWFDWGGKKFTDQAYEAAKKADQRYRKKSEQEELSPGHTGTNGDKGGLSLKRREEKRKHSSPEMLPAVTDDEWEQREQSVLTSSNYPALYRDLAALLGESNVSGKVRRSRVVRELYEPLLAVEKNGVGTAAFEYGLRAALRAGAPNVNYVKKAAKSCPDDYEPQTIGPSPAPEGMVWCQATEYDEKGREYKGEPYLKERSIPC